MSSSPTTALELEDMREIIRILGEVAASELTLNQKRINLMRGVASLIQCDVWMWGIPGKFKPGEQATFSLSHHEGFSDDQFSLFLKVLEKPKMTEMIAPVLEEFKGMNCSLTRRRDQIDPTGMIYTDAYSEWRDIDLAPLVMTLTPLSYGGTSCVAAYRHYDAPPFTQRESKIMHLILSEVSWLHDEAGKKPPVEGVYHLPPRLNTILNHLLQGHSRKEIASSLEITSNTLSSYLKEIYKRFGVHSQVELIHRFSIGDRGDE